LIVLTFAELSQASPQRSGTTQDATTAGLKAEKPQPIMRLVAIATHRIERENRQIRVYQRRQPQRLPFFTELLLAAPVDRDAILDNLVGKSVALVPSGTRKGQWDVYGAAVWKGNAGAVSRVAPVRIGAALTLAGNVFVVHRVFVSSTEHPITIESDGQITRLKPHQVLLVL
jgi:hypothetical protein